MYDWRFWARPTQITPGGNWRVWLLLGGRGAGKTRTGAEWVREQVETGRCRRLALVGATAADARDVLVEGESGILSISPPHMRPIYEASKRRLTWPNGAIATLYSADVPNRLRGPQHDGAWCDELAAWRFGDAWDQLLLGLRLGADPRVVVTTTPRPTKLIRDLVGSSMTHVTRDSTYANAANLAQAFLAQIVHQYRGTRLGRQEINAEILEDVEGALWNHAAIEASRVARAPDLVRVVVAVDPAVTAEAGSDETGIVIAGVAANGHGYVLDDVSGRLTPGAWGKAALGAYAKYKADRIVGEANNGGDLVENTIRTVRDEKDRPVGQQVSYRKVIASRGKYTRAEPIAALYEQGMIHHVGYFDKLEQQLTEWTPGGPSPDRLDALVWALTELQIRAIPRAHTAPLAI